MKNKKIKQSKTNKQYVLLILIATVAVITTYIITSRIDNYNEISNLVNITVKDSKKFIFKSSILFNDKGDLFKTNNSYLKLNNELKDEKIEVVELILIENNKKEKFLEEFNTPLEMPENEIIAKSYSGAVASWAFYPNNHCNNNGEEETSKSLDYLLFTCGEGFFDNTYSYYGLKKNGEFELKNVSEVLKTDIEYYTDLDMAFIIYYTDNTISEPKYYQVFVNYEKLEKEEQHIIP